MCSFHFWCLPRCHMRILCCKIKYSKWLPKTLKIAEKLLMHRKIYKRTSIMTNFGFNLRCKSTRKRKFYVCSVSGKDSALFISGWDQVSHLAGRGMARLSIILLTGWEPLFISSWFHVGSRSHNICQCRCA